MKVPFYYWIAVFFYGLIIFMSNFAETKFLIFSAEGFGYWLVLFLFSTCLGFIVSYLFGLKRSLWIATIVFLTISVVSTLITIITPSLFNLERSGLENIVKQNIKVLLSSIFGVFGILIWQSTYLAKELVRVEEKVRFYEKNVLDAKREAEILKKEAEVKANEMILEAKKKVQQLEKFKRDLELKIREFLQIELSVLDKHEEHLKE